jgi:hypothetical protein
MRAFAIAAIITSLAVPAFAGLAQDEEPGASGGEAGGGRGLEPVSSLLLKRASADRHRDAGRFW